MNSERASSRKATFSILITIALIGATQLTTTLAQGAPGDAALSLIAMFDRIPVDTMMSSGQSVASDCQDTEANHPYQPYDWPDANATLSIDQGAERTTVTIELTSCKAQHLLLRLASPQGQRRQRQQLRRKPPHRPSRHRADTDHRTRQRPRVYRGGQRQYRSQ